MQFNSYSYLLLLIPTVFLFWLFPARFRQIYVLGVSIAFYASWNAGFVLVPLLMALICHWSASALLAQPPNTRKYFYGGIGMVLAVFVVLRYGGLLGHVSAVLHSKGIPLELLPLGVPLGISFYSFESIAYIIDTKQRRIKNGMFLNLYSFLMFWPNLLSGPIVRFRELGPQLGFDKPFEMGMLIRGLDRLIWGLVQKNVIANSLASWVNDGFASDAVRGNTTIDNWTLAVGFGLQVYFDFAAYSNMAIGVAQLIGIALPENFRFPYHSRTPVDFWSRWHMTLSRWIRDYLFFPVNARFRGRPLPLYLSLVGVMGLVGLWHGAGAGFLAWGVMHGMYLVLYRVYENWAESSRIFRLLPARIVAIAWRGFTLVAVILAWVPFRAANIHDAALMLTSMCGRFRLARSYSPNFYLLVGLMSLFCAIEPLLTSALERAAEWFGRSAATRTVSYYIVRPGIYAVGLLLFLLFDDRNVKFIYFQF